MLRWLRLQQWASRMGDRVKIGLFPGHETGSKTLKHAGRKNSKDLLAVAGMPRSRHCNTQSLDWVAGMAR